MRIQIASDQFLPLHDCVAPLPAPLCRSEGLPHKNLNCLRKRYLLFLCGVDVRCKIGFVFPLSHLLLLSSLTKIMARYEMQGVHAIVVTNWKW